MVVTLLDRRWVRALAALAVVLALGAAVGFFARDTLVRLYFGLPAYSHEVGEVRTQMVPMRDGVRLSTRVTLPAGDGPWPTVLVRNPYDVGGVFSLICGIFVRNGYACVHQDVRGRMGSEGDWVPMVSERDDGLDTLDWLVAQDFVDGNIALYGMSYLASVQWAVADALPPEVKTMIPLVYGTDGYLAQYEGGLFKHEVITAWAALMPADDMRLDNGPAYHAAIRHRPAIEADEVHLGRRLDWYRTWIEADTRSATFWNLDEVRFVRQQPARTKVPVLAIGGWFDVFCAGQFQDFANLRRRDESRFLVGPWHHLHRSDVPMPGDVGERGQWLETLEWLDHHLRGAPYARKKGVYVTYAVGEGEWHEREDWPPPTEPVAFGLEGLADAGRCPGGRLTSSGDAAGEAAYTYDPDDPVPSQGGAALLAFAFGTFGGVTPGPVTQDARCARQDVLTFGSEPLKDDLHIAGRIRAELRVSSSAPDTAFTIRVMEEDASGARRLIRDGARTLALRASDVARTPYTPDAQVDLRIETWPIEWRVPAGHRLVVEVSSSNFPALHAHTNRYGPWAAQTGADVATNRVHAPSRIVVPVWAGE